MGKEVCGACMHHLHDRRTGEWTCGCESSEYYGLETGYGDTCDAHEERASQKRGR